MIRRVHARSQFVRSYTNVHVNRMTGSVRTGPPVIGVKVGAAGNKRGKKEDCLSLFFVVGAIVAVLRGGSSRLNTASPWEASRRPLSLYNFNSRLDDFVRLTPFFFLLFLALRSVVEHGCAQTTGARPPGCSRQIREKICRRFFVGRAHSNRLNLAVRWIIHVFRIILRHSRIERYLRDHKF